MRILIIGFLALILSSCASTTQLKSASTQLKNYVGKPIQEANLEFGKPVNIINLSKNKRAYQYYWGGDTVAIPISTNSTTIENSLYAPIDITFRPATTAQGFNFGDAISQGLKNKRMMLENRLMNKENCLVSLIASKTKGLWIVSDWKVPQKILAC